LRGLPPQCRTLATPAIMAFLLSAASSAMKPTPMVADIVQRGVIPGVLSGDFPMKSEAGTETGKALPVIAGHCHPLPPLNVVQSARMSLRLGKPW
jgi:hypothetical protein